MPYLLYSEQLEKHISFLRSRGLDVTELKLGTDGFISCREINGASWEKHLAYKSFVNPMYDGSLGIVTVCRLADKSLEKFKTYGTCDNTSSRNITASPIEAREYTHVSDACSQEHEDAGRKARYFFARSSTTGGSDYLDRKRVGSYGIRFRTNSYGRVAVVPLRDVQGAIWSYQILNGDGTKRFAERGQVNGMLHSLTTIFDGNAIGIAESYVTAATCYELSGITCVSAFFCENLQSIAIALRAHYSASEIILFADNDRCSKKNNGLLKAFEAAQTITNARVVAPDFGDIPASKSASDWNDLMVLIGVDEARKQLLKKISDTSH